MFPILALLMAVVPPAPVPTIDRFDDVGSIFATVGHSEWCPAGNVRLDLRTGQYLLVRTAPRDKCGDPAIRRRATIAMLDPLSLRSIRAAYRRAEAEGLRGCEPGRALETVVISNGGTPILVLTSGARSIAAPHERSCWSGAANDLYRAVDDAFRPVGKR